jgi:hypothetical protein
MAGPGMTRTTMFAMALSLAVLAGGCAHRAAAPFVPELRTGSADEVGPRLSNYSEATIPKNGSIVVRSDDFVGTAAPVPAAGRKPPKPVVTVSLADALAEATGLSVIDQSKRFETLSAAAQRLKDAAVGNLLILCYGFGDAATPPQTDFRTDLIAMIRAAHDRGAAVYLVVEPATALPLSATVEPYRAVFRAVAASEGAGLIDSPAILQKADKGPSKTAVQPKAAVDIIAGNIAAYVKLAPKSNP